MQSRAGIGIRRIGTFGAPRGTILNLKMFNSALHFNHCKWLNHNRAPVPAQGDIDANLGKAASVSHSTVITERRVGNYSNPLVLTRGSY